MEQKVRPKIVRLASPSDASAKAWTVKEMLLDALQEIQEDSKKYDRAVLVLSGKHAGSCYLAAGVSTAEAVLLHKAGEDQHFNGWRAGEEDR